MNEFVKQLRQLLGRKVRLNFYIPAGATVVEEEEVVCFKGIIKKVVSDENSGFLEFEHAPWFAEKAGFSTSYLNLNGCVIFQVDEFPEDYDWSHYKEDD